MEKNIEAILEEKYLEPTKKDREHFIGVEIELPVLNLLKKPVEKELMQKLIVNVITRFGLQVTGRDEEGKIYAAQHPENGDIYTFDCSYNNVEISFGKEKNIWSIWNRFQEYYQFTNQFLGQFHYTLTGMGINPYRNYNVNKPIPNGRYRMLYHHLKQYKKKTHPTFFHHYPEFGMFASASQVQVDVEYENLAKTIAVFSKLEPLKALLFSNSVLEDESRKLLCARDMLWENSMQGYNLHNVGMYEVLPERAEDLISYMKTTSIYCAERDGKYINFEPILVEEYFDREEVTGEYYQDGAYHTITFQPQKEDVEYLRTFKFIDLTFRGTLEFRSCCCQPIKDSMCVAAFHVGLMTKVEELKDLLDCDTAIYHKGYSASELRRLFVSDNLPATISSDEVKALLLKVLNLAKKGLKSRGQNEEAFLECLYERVEMWTNPAKEYLKYMKQGRVEEAIALYAEV